MIFYYVCDGKKSDYYLDIYDLLNDVAELIADGKTVTITNGYDYSESTIGIYIGE